ncbi:MAG TPA: GNAT family N-acetyltransferase [Steroidobacteraceae bacterium]|nr:GNAT family N-acetyltransferase [Steroidobacteraceae bacterium]
MTARFIRSIADVPRATWNALVPDGWPFVRHEFLNALETHGCVGGDTGWEPAHLVIEDGGELVGALPLYLKVHSWGEFVFDWSWARAYAQAGIEYYPKLVSMVPFTPATGPHLLVGKSNERRAQVIAELIQFAKQSHVSSAHLLFLNESDRDALNERDFLWRKDCQFHWSNRGYASFDDFLATFRADKRKKALRERRRIREQGIEFRTVYGEEMNAKLWNVVFGFSAATFAAHGNEHYLNVGFFRDVAAALPRTIMVKIAEVEGTPIAAAIFFRSQDTLYGRYWGAAADFHSLHFETCYYQGIEYCIAEGLQRFEPGTQGEHKVPRGFEPTTTWSAHWIADPRFRRAIAEYLQRERDAIDQYAEQVKEHVPFRRDMDLSLEVK